MADEKAKSRRQVSTQLFLLAIVAALIGPGLIFTGLLISRYEASERSGYERQARSIAAQVANAIDLELTGISTTLQSLSTSARFSNGDLAGFYDQARAVSSFIAADVGLRALDGRQLLNTRVAWGAALPPMPLSIDAQVIRERHPGVSDVFTGEGGARPLFAVVVPIPPAAEPRQLLSAIASTDRMAEIIRKNLPEGWVIGVADRRGYYVARSDRNEEFSGKPGLAAFTRELIGTGGSFTGENPFGAKILVGYVRSSRADWVIAASIPSAIVEAPLRREIWLLMGFGLAALLISSLLTYWLWEQIARPIRRLTEAGAMVGTSEANFDVGTQIREIDQLATTMAKASRGLLDREQARAMSETALRESEARLQRANEVLEARVEDRTRELTQTNQALRAEMAAREAAEGQLRQVQKMEAIGQLSGGIAHDFNNMLAVIVGGLSLARTRLERGDLNIGRFVAAALEGAQRAAALTGRLLAFARQQPLSPTSLDVNELVTGMAELLHRALGETVRLETVLEAGLWQVHADQGQLENAILNLAVNAQDAMPEGGRLTIETANFVLDEIHAPKHPGIPPGPYVLIAMTDTGSGMSPDVLARAFDPFFTTKEVGKGTGLGLSQVYGFVRQSGGHVRISSTIGERTTIRIYLPRHVGPREGAAPQDVRAVASVLGQGEAILVVEDEEEVRRVTADSLRELGYEVLCAAGARSALEVLRDHPDIRLLFTDVIMPETNGRQLAAEALRRRPDLKVLYMTGFTRNAVVHDGVLEAGVSLLQKPFTLDQLASKVRAALDAC
jgi:signal transduction histidine kinase/CheY-like chemotaxis protein